MTMPTGDGRSQTPLVSSLALQFRAKFKHGNQKKQTDNTRGNKTSLAGSTEDQKLPEKDKCQSKPFQKPETKNRGDHNGATPSDGNGLIASSGAIDPTEDTQKKDTNDIREKTQKWFEDVDLERSTCVPLARLHP